MTNVDLDRAIADAELNVKRMEAQFGLDHIAVAEQLMKLAALLRQKKRLLDAVNLEARARVIMESQPVDTSHRPRAKEPNSCAQNKSAKLILSQILGHRRKRIAALSPKDASTLKWCAVLMGAFVILSVVGRVGPTGSDSESMSTNASASGSSQTRPMSAASGGKPIPGERGYLARDAAAANTEHAYSEMMDAGMTKDSIGMGQLSLSGSVALLPAGTKVLVLAIGGPWLSGWYKVRVLSGENFGHVCYVDFNSVAKDETSQ